MSVIKAKVIGPNPILGVHNDNYVDLDTDLYNVQMLVDAGHVELSKTQDMGTPEVATIEGEPSA